MWPSAAGVARRTGIAREAARADEEVGVGLVRPGDDVEVAAGRLEEVAGARQRHVGSARPRRRYRPSAPGLAQ